MTIKYLLRVMALIEGGTGLSLLFRPSVQARQIMGVTIGTPLEMFLGRSFGTALIAISMMCWLAGNDPRGKAAYDVVKAMLFYNTIAGVLLVHARVGLGLYGPLFWLGIAVHVGMGAWCAVELQRE